jgi:hypothetical protein
METLNQYALSQSLGSRMRPVKAPQFGNFGLLPTTVECLQARESQGQSNCTAHFSYAEDKVAVQAFEAVRQGMAPDAILWNKELSRAFCQRCRELGLDAPDAFLARRLINVRKNKGRYEKHGIHILPATVSDPHHSVLPQFAHAIEFALVKLRFRYGASIDDILLDPFLSDHFEKLALGVAPQLSSQDVRLGALSLRKSRFLRKDDQTEATLDLANLDASCSAPVPLSEVDESEVPATPGLIELREGLRFLYISRNESLRPTVHQFLSGNAFSIMESNFWEPRLDDITLQYVVGEKCQGVSMNKWERRLIQAKEPVFNWPMQRTAA